MSASDQSVVPSSLRHLAIVTVPDGFLFYNVDQPGLVAERLTLEAPIDFPERFEAHVAEKGWTKQALLRISISQHSDRFMVIPAGISDPVQVRTLFDTAFIKGEPSDLTLFPMSDGKQAFCCEWPTAILNAYKGVFHQFAVYCPTFLLSEWVFREAGARQETLLLAYQYGACLHLMVSNPGRLLFINTFNIRGEHDALYFTLRVVEQMNLAPFKVQAYVGSPFQEPPALYDALAPYLKERSPFVYTGLPEAPVLPVVY